MRSALYSPLARDFIKLPTRRSVIETLMGTPRVCWPAHEARGDRPVQDDFSGFPRSHDVEALLELCYGKRCVMIGAISRPLCNMTVILYQVSYISRP